MKALIVGCGTMGRGIAYLFLKHNYFVQIYDENFQAIEKTLNYFKEYEKNLPSDYLKKLKVLENLNNLDKETEIVIEAIIEDFEKKSLLFKKLEPLLDKNCIIGTNTSSLSINELSESIKFKERFMGIHFFNPPAIMKLVEIVKSKFTNENYLNKAIEILRSLSKEVVICKDSPGFIVNRIARPFYLSALKMYEEGIDFKLIDKVMKIIGFKMGPFELMDLIGIDINYNVSKIIYEKTKLERLKPSKIQEEMVKKGYLGIKTNKGFYEYPRETEKFEFKNKLNFEGVYDIKNFKFFTIGYGAEVFDFEDEIETINKLKEMGFEHFVLHNYKFSIAKRIIDDIKLEAKEVYNNGIASREDINKAMKLGTNYPFDVI
ncbi:MAG: 3-hydroxyacyl-CoA dehydrogenase family protein [candidate division WOR-3 bacterium]